MTQASKPKRKTHAENFIEHLKKAPNQTLRRCDLIDLYWAHSAGRYGPMNNSVERVIGAVAERVGYGLYRLREEYRDDMGPAAAPPGAVLPAASTGLTFDTGPLVSAWDVPCPECGVLPSKNCIKDPRNGWVHSQRQELADKVRRRVSRLPNKGRRVPSEAT